MTINSLDLNYSRYEYLFMVFQCGLIAGALLGWPRRLSRPDRTASLSFCLLAIVAGWCWRLGAVFVLAAAGFNYLSNDDPCRWDMSWRWSQHPYLLTWDGVWQTGTFALHGLAMKLVDDPLVASKMVSVLYCLMPLLGVFLFTLGVFGRRGPACATVLVTAPLWLHILLSTGTMTEMPVAAFMLSGAGLLLLALRRPPSRPRFWLFAASALMFNLGTAFHTTAWMQLATVLAALIIYAAGWGGKARFGVGKGIVFALVSSLFCFVWLGGSWLKFGNPLHTFTYNNTLLLRDVGRLPLWTRLAIYPQCLLFTHKSVLPLLGFGLVWSWFAGGPDRARRRAVLAVLGLGLLVMMASALIGGVTRQARATIIIATALVPFMVAPFFPQTASLVSEGQSALRPLGRGSKCAFLGLAGLAGLFFLLTNYQNTLSHQRMTNPLRSDSIAMGAWLRQEMIRPQTLHPENLVLPVRICDVNGSDYDNLGLIYEAGFRSRLELSPAPHPETLRPGQLLISVKEINDPRLKLVTRVGSYLVYRFT